MSNRKYNFRWNLELGIFSDQVDCPWTMVTRTLEEKLSGKRGLDCPDCPVFIRTRHQKEHRWNFKHWLVKVYKKGSLDRLDEPVPLDVRVQVGPSNNPWSVLQIKKRRGSFWCLVHWTMSNDLQQSWSGFFGTVRPSLIVDKILGLWLFFVYLQKWHNCP